MEKEKENMVLEGLLIVFVILKLFGVITWSWWLVFMPLYLWIAMLIGIIAGKSGNY